MPPFIAGWGGPASRVCREKLLLPPAAVNSCQARHATDFRLLKLGGAFFNALESNLPFFPVYFSSGNLLRRTCYRVLERATSTFPNTCRSPAMTFYSQHKALHQPRRNVTNWTQPRSYNNQGYLQNGAGGLPQAGAAPLLPNQGRVIQTGPIRVLCIADVRGELSQVLAAC